MSCCHEYGCRRRTPIGIYRGAFTGQVYAATRSRLISDHGDGSATLCADQKHDITEQMRRFIRENRDWVLAELEKQP